MTLVGLLRRERVATPPATCSHCRTDAGTLASVVVVGVGPRPLCGPCHSTLVAMGFDLIEDRRRTPR